MEAKWQRNGGSLCSRLPLLIMPGVPTQAGGQTRVRGWLSGLSSDPSPCLCAFGMHCMWRMPATLCIGCRLQMLFGEFLRHVRFCNVLFSACLVARLLRWPTFCCAQAHVTFTCADAQECAAGACLESDQAVATAASPALCARARGANPQPAVPSRPPATSFSDYLVGGYRCCRHEHLECGKSTECRVSQWRVSCQELRALEPTPVDSRSPIA